MYLTPFSFKCFTYLGFKKINEVNEIKTKKLSEIAEIYTGVRLNRLKEKNTGLKKVIRKISSENILEYEYSIESVPNSINEKFLSQKNDIIISLLDPGSACKLEKEGLIIPMQFAIIRLDENYDADFIINLLKSDLFKKELNKLVEGSGLKIIKSTYLKEVKLPLPDFEKQVKTGELLKLIEKRIILNSKKIELEKQLKQAILNKTIGGK
ncbi:MAG: restriction endonuclease subunit S [Methanobrevibacter millerae]|uniref:Restriction endonuclease subunit S n=1 Tax=Methanobrevibacter millerae TaxID=230361 RepID=A0A8T3VBK2_9EURY|nr:restriction endonuclease subunit S [Methanobrevibacter millerae]